MTRIPLNPDTLAVESFTTAPAAVQPSTTIIANSPLCGPSAFDSCETQC